MQVTCGDCGARYDDAVCWTICPHEQFISDEVAAQKDLAYSLLGKSVIFAHEVSDAARNNPFRVIAMRSSVTSTMVELEGMVGQFAPHLFTVI